MVESGISHVKQENHKAGAEMEGDLKWVLVGKGVFFFFSLDLCFICLF